MKKRILSVLITLVMLISLVTVMSISASAAGTHSHCICGETHASVGDHTTEQSVEWTAWNGTSNITYTDKVAYLYLTADVTLSQPIKIDGGNTLYLCLNGYSVKSGIKSSAEDRMAFWPAYGNLVLTDCGTDTREGHIDATTGLWTEGAPNDAGDISYNLSGGVITGFDNRQGGAISAYNGSVTVFGVNICGNTAPKTGNNSYEGGGAVNATGNVTANLYNVTMSGNATGNDGGAVISTGSGTFTMINCTLEYNKAEDIGGAIYIGNNNVKVTLEDCIIRKNTANKYAGGIFIYRGNATLDNSTLTQNTASSTNDSVGGVYICSSGALTVNRGTRIIGNTVNGAEKNAYLEYNGSIIIGNSGLSDGAKIGVTTEVPPQNSAPISISNQCDADYSSYFLSDNLDLYHIENKIENNKNVVVLAKGETLSYTVTFDANGQSCTVPDKQTVFGTERVSEPTTTPEAEGYVFDGWYKDAACTEAFVFGTSITGDITLYAKWIKVYDLWVGGVQVTSANKDNVDGNNKVSYDPATKTLTLNGYSYTGEGYEYNPSWYCAAIYFNPADENAELTIELVGTNTVIIDNSECTSFAIYIANGNLIIEGNGSLTATGDTGIYAWGNISISDENTSVIATGNYGIQTNGGDIDIDGGKVEANGGYNGIVAYGNISISGGEVKATATPEYGTGIYAEDNIDIDGGKVEANGGYGGIYADGNIDIDGDKVDATGSLDYGIYAAGPLTINGGIVTVKGSEAGIYVENNITIDSGTVKATASGEHGIGIVVAGTVFVNGGTVEVISTGEHGYGITTHDGVSCNGDFDVYAGESAPGELVTSPTTSTYNSKYVKITPVPPHEHCVCGATHAPVGDHTAEQPVEWTAWDGTSAITYDENGTAYVYLSANAERTSALVIPTGKTLNLCLNGKELKNAANNQRVIDVQGGTLNLTDCGSTGTITGGKFNSGNYSDVTGIGVRVKDNGTFNMYGGTISGNKNAEDLGHSAGAVSVGYEFYGSESIGTFNMYGGTISDNASYACGGVYVNRGSFTMYGGTISNNTARYGGGVLVSYAGTFTMTGGSIANNTCPVSGAGVENRGTFIMTDGTISGNTCTDSDSMGAGVYNRGDFTMTGGTISGNTAGGVGGGVYHSDWADDFKLSGSPTISGNNVNGADSNVYLDEVSLTIDENFAPTTSIGISVYEFGCFAKAADGADIEDISEYAKYFVSDSNAPIYTQENALYIGYKITDDPDAENNYTISVNSATGASYQWYSVETDEVTVTYDFLVEQVTGFDYWYQENFDSETNKWTSVGFSGGHGYLYVALNAGETFIAEFDSALPAGYVAFLGGWDNDNVIQATQQNGNIYTFKATEAGSYVLMVAEEDEEPVALSEVVIPNAVCKMNALVYTPLDGQTSATLDTTNLPTSTYVCKATWNMGTPDNSEDDYSLTSAPITLQYYDVTFDYGSFGSETKMVLSGKTVTPPAPVFAGKVLVGWYTDSNFTTEFNFSDAITANKTIYAKFADYEDDKKALQDAIDDLETAVDNVETALDNKVSTGKLTEEVGKLNIAIQAAKDYADTQDAALKAAIEGAGSVLNTAINALKDRVTAIENQLGGIDLTQIATNKTAIETLTTELATVKSTVDQLDNTFINNTELTNALAALKGELEDADDALEVLIDTLDGRVDDIEDALDGIDLSQIATNKQDIIDLTTELGNLDDLVNTINTNYASADANLQTQITALDTKLTELIDETIAELTDSVNKLKDDLNTANGKIDTNTGDITTLKTNVSTLKTWQTEAQNAIEALETLTGTQGTNISALQTAVAELQATMNTANGKIAAAENRIATLEGKVSALETAKQELEDAVSALQTAVATKADAATVNVAIAELQTAINALEAAKNNYATADDALRTELEGKIETAKGEAISAAETLVNNAKAELQSKIDAKADAATTTAAIQNLQAAVAALEAVKDDYATADATLKTELEGKIANAQTAAVSAAETLVNNAKAELQSKIDAKADAATTTVAIQNLQAAVAALEAVKDDYATADATLKAELEGKIETAKSEAITAANTALTTAKNELSQAIALKADTATLNAKVDALNTAIVNAESVAKAYADTQDAALKAELQTAIANAKSEAIGAAQLLVDNAKAELQTAIDTKADTATVNAAIANLQNAITALEAAKDNYASADAALKLELEAAIERAKQEAIEASKGYIPYIGTNGNWWIGDTDTGVDANGIKGDTGEQGPQGEKGDKGDTGATGNGIASITTSKANGITTVTIKFTDPNMADVVFTIEDGADGADGAKGDKGDTGAQGAQGEKGDKGDKGDTGAQGEKGDKGNTGAAGADGVGIANIEKTSSDGNVDTYTITLTNGTTYTFTVTNGTNGTDGKDGVDGKDGKDGTNGTNGVDGKDGTDGEDGQTPYIGENGNWWIGNTDTCVKAAGDDGKDGAVIVATAVGGTALISNIALIAWTLIKKKRLF